MNRSLAAIFVSITFLLLLQSCMPEEKSIFTVNMPEKPWLPYLAFDNSTYHDYGYIPDWEWLFLLSDDSTWQVSTFPNFNEAQPVSIPHRLLAPNTPFWYKHIIHEDIDDKAVFFINADDGVQVFLNDLQIPVEHGFFYPIESLRSGDKLVLRVLNDAGSGGIRELKILTENEFDDIVQYNDSAFDSLCLTIKALQYADTLIASDRLTLLSTPNIKTQIEDKNLPYFTVFPYIIQTDQGPLEISVASHNATAAFIDMKMKGGEIKRKKMSPIGEFFHITVDAYEWRNDVKAYRVVLDDRAATSYIYLPEQSDRDGLKVALWSDSQGGWSTFHDICTSIAGSDIDYHMGLGDLVATGYVKSQWKEFFIAGHEAFKSVPGIFIAGNHDYDGYYDDGLAKLIKNYILRENYKPVRSYQNGDVYFLMIDLNASFPIGVWHDSNHRAKIKEIIGDDAWKEARYRVLLVHQPSVGEADGGYDGEPATRDVIRGIRAISNGVDLVVSGHNHVYERKVINDEEYGRYLQLTVGGAGRVNETVTNPEFSFMDTVLQKHHFAIAHFQNDKINIKVLSPSGELFDNLEYYTHPQNEKE